MILLNDVPEYQDKDREDQKPSTSDTSGIGDDCVVFGWSDVDIGSG